MLKTRFIVFVAALCMMVGSQPSAASANSEEVNSAPHVNTENSRGKQLFLGCVGCHGSDGSGRGSAGIPAIAGQYPSIITKQLADFRQGQRWDLRMERIAYQHGLQSPQDIEDVATYVSSMPVRPTSDYGDAELLDQGGSIYLLECASCHGPAAAGSDAKHVPRLAGQSYQYLLRQMYKTADKRRPNLSGLHVSLFRQFTSADFAATADYLSRLTP